MRVASGHFNRMSTTRCLQRWVGLMWVFLLYPSLCSAVRDIYLPTLVSQSGQSRVEGAMPSGISKDLVRRVAINNTLVVTWANAHYADFAANFVNHMRRLKITNFLVGAMDKELLDILQKDKVNTWYMGSKGMDQNSVKADFGWGSPKFHKMGRDKIRLIRDFAKIGLDVLISDIDVVWLEDPFPYLARFPAADMLVSTDQLRNQSQGDELEFHICQTASNIGMMWIRSTPGTIEMTQRWLEVIEGDPNKWDQVAFNDLKAEGKSCAGARDKDGLMQAYNGKVLMGILPVALFSNGHTFYVQHLQDRLDPGLKPYAVHATFQYGGTPGKRHRMREAGVWLGDRTSYFDDGGHGFVSYEPRIPSDVDLEQFRELGWPSPDGHHPVLETRSPVLQAHTRMVNFQLQQFRDALVVAWLAGRRLVAPPILCGLDRVWFPHSGRFPGSILRLPFECPLDHVVRIEHVFRRSKHGELPFKEHSFLANPQLPAPPTSYNQVIVHSKAPESSREAFGNENKQHAYRAVNAPERMFPSKLNATELKEMLKELRDVRFLHFTNMVDLFRGFETSERHLLGKFATDNNVDQGFGDEWCCTKGGPVKYNFLGDFRL